MAFITKRDYFTEIREKDLDELLLQIAQETSKTPLSVRQENELNTQAVMETMIRHRYDVELIFKEIETYDNTVAYAITDLVEYSEPRYDPSDTYVINDLVSHSYLKDEGGQQVQANDIFKATSNVTSAEDFDISKWTKVTENESLYFAEQPSTGNKPGTAFGYTVNAFTNNHDLVLGWDKSNTIFLKRILGQIKLYYSSADRTADADSIGIVDYDPVAKIFPDNRPIEQGEDIENSVSGDLSVIGFIPDTTEWDVVPSNFWIKGDNRSRTIRKILINMAIAELHKLISPRNIPEQRLEAKDDAMMLLKKISKGEVTPDLPIYFDEQRGQNLVWGSNPKRRMVF